MRFFIFNLIGLSGCITEDMQDTEIKMNSMNRPFEMLIADQHQIYSAKANDWDLQFAFEIDGLEKVRALSVHDEFIGIAPSYPQDRVLIIDRESAETISLTNNDLEEPVQILFDEDFISVLCNDSGRVLRYDRFDFSLYDQFGAIDGHTALRFAHDMKTGPEGNLHIATESRQFGRLQRWTPDGAYLGSYETLDEDWFPSSISLDKTGRLWAADYLFSRIRVFDVETGSHIQDIQLDDKPLSIQVGLDNNIYIGFEEDIAILNQHVQMIQSAPLDFITDVFALGN